MLVSHLHKFVFLKSHKTASTTCELLLQPFCVPRDYPCEMEGPCFEGKEGIVGARGKAFLSAVPMPKWVGHMGIGDIIDRLGMPSLDGYEVISSVRNPFTRAISQFHFNRSYHGLPPFDDPEEAISTFEAEDFAKGYPTDLALLHHKGRYIPNHTIRFEALSADLHQLFETLGLTITAQKLPHARRSDQDRLGLTTTDYFRNPKIADAIRVKDAWIFKRFGYALDPVHA